jgi:lysophospholipase L1-like esterase
VKNIFYWFLLGLIFVIAIGIILFSKKNTQPTKKSTKNDQLIRYVALGDSYTIGLRVDEQDNWPSQLVKKLNQPKEKVVLMANLGVSGYTTEDVTRYEVPQLQVLKPDFVTLLIGANDNFIGLDKVVFKNNFQALLDKIQNSLINKKNLILITVPDHSKTPSWQTYTDKEEISQSIAEYNDIIKDEAQKRELTIIDIFPLSQTLTDEKYYIEDGLHPSREGYRRWAEIILEAINKFSLFTP